MNTATFSLSVKLSSFAESRKEDISKIRLNVPMKPKLPTFLKSYEVLLLPAK